MTLHVAFFRRRLYEHCAGGHRFQVSSATDPWLDAALHVVKEGFHNQLHVLRGFGHFTFSHPPRTQAFFRRGIKHHALNIVAIAQHTAGLLDRLMNGHKGPNQTIVVSPKSVVLRQSTDFLAVTTSHVLKVLEYMRTHFSSGITVEELARQVPISRSVLYRLFIEEVGHSMVEETKLRIGEISKQSGFNGNISFSRAFQSATGESPSEYRAKYSPICHDSTILPRGES